MRSWGDVIRDLSITIVVQKNTSATSEINNGSTIGDAMRLSGAVATGAAMASINAVSNIYYEFETTDSGHYYDQIPLSDLQSLSDQIEGMKQEPETYAGFVCVDKVREVWRPRGLVDARERIRREEARRAHRLPWPGQRPRV